MFYVIIITLLVILSYYVTYVLSKRRWYEAASKFNGPVAFPVIGNAYLLFGKIEGALMKMYNIIKNYPTEPFRFWLGPALLIVVANPGHAEKILSSSKLAAKHDVYDLVKVFLGEGLVSGSGPAHKQHRRLIQPMLGMQFVLPSLTVIQKHYDLCMERLKKFEGRGTFNFHSVLDTCVVDIINEIILGTDEKCQINGKTAFAKAMSEGYLLVFTRMVKPYLQIEAIFKMTPYKKLEKKIIRTLRSEVKKMLNDSYNRRNNNPNEYQPVIDQLADYVEKNPDTMTEDVLCDHLLTLYTAAEDTITIINGFLPICLGMYPEYQNRAAQEIRDIFGETPKPVTMEDIKKLKYVDMCIKDALRLFPIAPLIVRKCPEDFQIDKWTAPKGCGIVLSIFNIHRDERYWKKPLEFYPDHFLPEVEAQRPVYAYIPFSAGSRGCVGKILANTSVKMFICNLLQHFEIEADGKMPDLELKMDLSTRPKNGYKLRLKKRVWQ